MPNFRVGQKAHFHNCRRGSSTEVFPHGLVEIVRIMGVRYIVKYVHTTQPPFSADQNELNPTEENNMCNDNIGCPCGNNHGPKFVQPTISRTEIKSKAERVADIRAIAANANIPINIALAEQIDNYYRPGLK